MRRGRFVIALALVITLVAGIIPLIFMLGSQDATPFSGEFDIGKWVPFIIVPVFLVIMATAMRPLFRAFFPPNIKNGISAEAEVLEVRDTGVTINDDPQIALLLEVRPSMGAVFQAELKTLVSRLEVANYRPGCKAVVVYDPANPKRMVLQSIDPATSVPGSAEDRLTELTRLRDRGLITAAEYERKREEILKLL
jgi:hypothetical protein